MYHYCIIVTHTHDYNQHYVYNLSIDSDYDYRLEPMTRPIAYSELAVGCTDSEW